MRYTNEQIATWVKEYESTGLSITEYSKDKPFHPSTFSYWISKRKVTNSFIELKPNMTSISTIEIRRPDGVVVSISKSISITEIIQLIKC